MFDKVLDSGDQVSPKTGSFVSKSIFRLWPPKLHIFLLAHRKALARDKRSFWNLNDFDDRDSIILSNGFPTKK